MAKGTATSEPRGDAHGSGLEQDFAQATRFWIEDLVGLLTSMGASDLHIKVGSAPVVRVHGELRPLEDYPALEQHDTLGLLHQMLADPVRLERLHRTGAVDFAYD